MGVMTDHTGKRSSGRFIAIGMSVVVAFRLVVLTMMGTAIGWPDAIVTIIAFLSIPLYHLFTGAQGAVLAGKLIDKLGIGSAGVNASGDVVKLAHEAMFRAHQWKHGEPDEGVL